jgi:hypothetical protein
VRREPDHVLQDLVRYGTSMGVDRNLDNVTTADTSGSIKRFGSLAQATKVKAAK